VDFRGGTGNIRSLCRAGSLITVLKELSKYKIRLDRSCTEPTKEYTYFNGNRDENHELGTGSFIIRDSHQLLRGWSLLVTGG
jgi:hypothetical protein